jgi:hypothetical protein
MIRDRVRTFRKERRNTIRTDGNERVLARTLPKLSGEMSFSLRCLFLGHDYLMVRAPERLWLRCLECGQDTPGWSVGRVRSPQSKPAISGAPHPEPILREAEHPVAA